MRRLLPAAIALMLVALLASCEGQGPTGGRPAPDQRETTGEEEQDPREQQAPFEAGKMIPRSLGGTLTLRDAELEIPPRSIRETRSFTLSFASEIPSGTVEQRAWQVSPSITTVRPMRLTLPYDTEQFEPGFDHSRLRIAREVRGTWFGLSDSEVNEDEGKITALIRRTGTFAVIRQEVDRSLSNEPPQADINVHFGPEGEEAPARETGPRELGFSAENSLDPDGEIVRYQWDLNGDGAFDVSESTPDRVSATYDTNGSHTAVLRVEDNHAPTSYAHATANFTVEAAGSVSGPLDLRASSYPPRGSAPLTVAFATTVTGGEMPYDFLWRFGDGEVSELAAPTHTYGEQGTYTAEVTVTDAEGTSRTESLEIRVEKEDEYPFPAVQRIGVDISPVEKQVDPGERVGFTVRSQDAAKPVQVTYYYGNEDDPGLPNRGSLPLETERSYDLPGAYLFTTVITDARGRTATDYSLIRVRSAGEPRVWEFVGGADRSTLPAWLPGIRINAEAQGPRRFGFSAAGADPESDGFHWKFGDGSETDDPEPVHSYSESGTYRVQLELERDGRIYHYDRFLPVSEGLTTAIQNPRVTGGVAPLQLGFNATARNARQPLTWEWDFGDGETSDVPQPVHTFDEPGSYEVSVRVTDERGRSATADSVTVHVVEGGAVYTNPVAYVIDRDRKPATVRITDRDGEPELDLPLGSETGSPRGLRLSPDGAMLAYRVDRRLSVRDRKTGKLLWSFEHVDGRPEHVRLVNSAELIGFNLNGRARIFTPEGREISVPSGLRLLDLGARANKALLRDGDGQLRLAEISGGDSEVGDPLAEDVESAVLSGNGNRAFFTNAAQEVLEIDLRPGADREPVVLNQDGARKTSLVTDRSGNTLAWIAERDGNGHPFVGSRNPDGQFETEDLFLTRSIDADRLELAASGDMLFYWGTKGSPERTPTAEEVVRGDRPARPSEMFGREPGEEVDGGGEDGETVEPGEPALFVYPLRENDARPSLLTRTWSDFAIAETGG